MLTLLVNAPLENLIIDKINIVKFFISTCIVIVLDEGKNGDFFVMLEENLSDHIVIKLSWMMFRQYTMFMFLL